MCAPNCMSVCMHTHAIGRPGATRSASSGGERRISSIFRRAATLPPYAHTHRRTQLPNKTEDFSAPFDNLTSAGLTSDVVQLRAVTAVLSAHGFKRCEMRAGERMSSVDTRKKKTPAANRPVPLSGYTRK